MFAPDACFVFSLLLTIFVESNQEIRQSGRVEDNEQLSNFRATMTKQSCRLVGAVAFWMVSNTASFLPMRQAKGRPQLSNTVNVPSSQVFLADDVVSNEPPVLEVPTTFMMASAKFRRLKDLMWIRETLEDLTTAEFASSLDAKQAEGQRKRQRAVDYDKLMGQLDNRLKDLGCAIMNADSESGVEHTFPKPVPGRGMGTLVYTDEQREALFK